MTTQLERMGVPYIVCGSIASIAYGEPRTTFDVDLVADLALEHADPLAQRLAGDFYVDAKAAREAVRRRSSFNLVHLASGQKIDVFVRRDRDFSFEELRRGRLVEVEPGIRLRLASPEDTLLTKLEWFRKGGEVSDRQWRDVLGILKVQAEELDGRYLRRWAKELRLDDLLQRALRQAGLD